MTWLGWSLELRSNHVTQPLTAQAHAGLGCVDLRSVAQVQSHRDFLEQERQLVLVQEAGPLNKDLKPWVLQVFLSLWPLCAPAV